MKALTASYADLTEAIELISFRAEEVQAIAEREGRDMPTYRELAEALSDVRAIVQTLP